MVAAAAEFTVTSAVSVTVTVLFTLAVTVFVPASVELKAPVIWPLVLVVPAGCVSVIPVAGFAASVTVAPLTGLPLASFTVTVIVLALDPELAVIVPGEAATSDSVALAPAGFTVTGAVWATLTLPFTMALTVFVPAAVELNEPVICPPAFVGSTVPWPPRVASVTATPGTGLANWSRTITEGGVATAVPTVAA